MQDTGASDMHIVIISDDRHQSGLLRQAIEQRGMRCGMQRIEPSLRSGDAIRRLEAPGNTSPDMVLFDLSHPDPEKLQALKRVAFGKRRARSPVVILTSDFSERLLEDAGVADSRSIMFEPAELSCFLKKMHEHRSARFKRALNVMYELGPILVRLPRSFVDGPETLMA